MPVPEVGQDIYIGSALYLGHGRDDRVGGLARVTSVNPEVSGGRTVLFVTVAEVLGSFNWEFLEAEQEKLKARFGINRAHPDPDYDPQFNEP